MINGIKWDKAGLAAWSLVAFCVCGFTWFILKNGAFNNDDLDNFLTIENGNIWELLITPLHGHWSPFHRFSTWLVYWVAPMRFEVAVIVLMLFHAGALVYLYATLRAFGLRVADKVILCMYASCALLIYGMIWWANAQLRVPHTLFCAAAIFHYITWLKGNSNKHLWLALAAYLLDMLVYQKAVLIPVYMLVIGYLSESARFRSNPVSAASLPAALLAVSILFVIAFKYLSPPQIYIPGIKDVLRMEWQFLSSLSGAVMGLMVNKSGDLGSSYVMHQQYATLCILLAVLAASLRASFGTWKIWVAMLGVLFLDYLPVSTSSRFLFGTVVTYSYRYHYEVVYLIAIFAGLICAKISHDRKSQAGRVSAKIFPVAVVIAYTAVNIVSLAIAREKSWEFGISRNAHGYMNNLQAGLDRIKEPAPTFVDSAVPGYMALLVGPKRTEKLVPLFIPDVRFTDASEADYQVLESGEVVARPRP